jgi:hypothetical protein
MTSANMLDHVKAMLQVIDDDNRLPRFSHWSLTRTAIEAAATVHHLYAVGEVWQVRLLRAAVIWRDNAQRSVRVTRQLPLPSTHEIEARRHIEKLRLNAEMEQDHVTQILSDAGMVDQARGKRSTPTHLCCSRPDGATPLRRNLTTEINDLCVDTPSVYARGSATVHSNMWGLSGILVEDPSHPTGMRPQASDPSGICAATDIAFAACAVTTRAYGGYFGVQVEDELKRIELRRAALTVAIREYYAK